MAESPDLKLGPVRKRKRSLLTAQLRPDFVHPAGPGDLPWAWRLADSLSSPRPTATNLSATRSERTERHIERHIDRHIERHPTIPNHTMRTDADAMCEETKRCNVQSVEVDWEPFFREGDERTLPEKLIFEKSALPWAWRLPFTCEPWNSFSMRCQRRHYAWRFASAYTNTTRSQFEIFQ